MQNSLKTLIKDLSIIFTAVLVFNTFAYAQFYIPSGSMEPTLEVGDRVGVSKFAYGYNQYSIPFSPSVGEDRILYAAPKRGDVAVFTHPTEKNNNIIKRVVGLPGDSIQMKNGRLYINDEMVKRKKIRLVNYTNYRQQNITVHEYLETFPDGSVHHIYERSDAEHYDNTAPIVVPKDHFFMMGDNRDSSADSRSDLGPVAKEYLLGRAEVTTFSLYDCDQGKDIACPVNVPIGRFFNKL